MVAVSCKIERTPSKEDIAANSNTFDPAKAVTDIWQSQVVPFLDVNAKDFKTVRALELQDIVLAGEQFGHKDRTGNAPWTFIVRLEGLIISANTESRASTIDVDHDGDAIADAVVQIGPAIRGTALRDSLDFVSFNDFKNQIEYAQFGKAFNNHIKNSFLNTLERESLVGASVKLIGSYQHKKAADLPIVTPASLTVMVLK